MSTFVRASGTTFECDGQPFRLAGANNYYLGFASDSMVRAVFDLASQMGLNVLRIWAFLDCATGAPDAPPANAKSGVFFHYWDTTTQAPAYNDGPDGLARLDRTIAWAEEAGIRLILPLINYWDDFGGVRQYLDWFGLGSRDQFYRRPEPRQAYKNYAAHVLLRVNTLTGRRYCDEPAILAWELANEPRCVSADGDRLSDGIDTLTAWAEEMSAYLKSIDPNHLVGVGDEGYFCCSRAGGNKLYNGAHGVDCERLLGIPSVDFGTCHLYPSFAGRDDPAKFGARWIREHIEAGQRAFKPILIEEYGWKLEGSSAAVRDATFRLWLDEVTAAGGAGALLWMIASNMDNGQRYPDYDGYTVYSADEVPSVVADAAACT
jgi:mannan endo-1,4-beta-mannosidase